MTEVETNGHERREDDPRCVKCGKAWPCEGWLLEPPRLQPAPIPASPARDVRIAAYRDRERRRAARALDRYFETLLGDTVGMGPAVSVAGERFVEDIGDYVAARLLGMLPDGMSVTYDRSPLQQKSHYGVPADAGDWCDCTGHTATRMHPRGVTGCNFAAHNADHGAEPDQDPPYIEYEENGFKVREYAKPHNADSAGGGFRTRLDDRGYSTTEPRNPDSVVSDE